MTAASRRPPARAAIRRPGRNPGATTLYHQIYMHLRQMLTEGALDPERALPSEPALAARYHVSRVTVRKTLESLEADGLIRRVRGVGTFPVALGPAEDKTNISGLLENLISFETSTTAVNLEWAEVVPEGEVARALGPDPCLRIVRLRSYREQPISLTTLHVAAFFAGSLRAEDSGDEPVIKVLERHGVVAERAEQSITAVAADAIAVEKLGVAAGSPLISMRRLMLDAERRPILHQESRYAPDRFEYRMTLTRTNVGPAARWNPIG